MSAADIQLQRVDTVRKLGADQFDVLVIGGGASSSDLLMQTQANLLNAAVERPKVTETTAQGAAFMAGIASGMWKNISELSKNRTVDHVFKPKISDDQRISQRANWKRALARASDWAQDECKGQF